MRLICLKTWSGTGIFRIVLVVVGPSRSNDVHITVGEPDLRDLVSRFKHLDFNLLESIDHERARHNHNIRLRGLVLQPKST